MPTIAYQYLSVHTRVQLLRFHLVVYSILLPVLLFVNFPVGIGTLLAVVLLWVVFGYVAYRAEAMVRALDRGECEDRDDLLLFS